MGGHNINNRIGMNIYSLVIKKPDGTLIKQYGTDQLRTINAIKITQDDLTGEYKIETFPAGGIIQKRESVNITFNNYPNDTYILINQGVAKIIPTRKDITIKGVKEVLIQNAADIDDATFVSYFFLDDLLQENIKSITITKDADTGAYNVTTE